MKIRFQNELLLINILVILLIAVIAIFPSFILRLVLGLPFVLFFPGYTLIAILFPRRGALTVVERVVLSFGFSIVLVSLIGFVLNYTPWGITLFSVLVSLAVFVFILSIVAWFRRRSLPPDEVFTVSLNSGLFPWRGQRTLDRVLSVILIAVMVMAVGTLAYFLVTPKVGEKYTEFYILGPEAKAADYTRVAVVDREQTVILGIINREQEAVSYRVRVTVNGVTSSEVGPLMLEHEEKWEEVVSFTPHQVGDKQKVEFQLYRGEENTPYQMPLRLWVDVEAAE